MPSSNGRFPSPHAGQLVHLHKNIYVNRHDPLYHDKVIRYLDPHSPEAHYYLGNHYERKGNRLKALQHYQEAMAVYPSDYYYKASSAIRRLHQAEERAAQAAALATATQAGTSVTKEEASGSLPSFMKAVLIVLLLMNVALLLVFFMPTIVPKVVSELKPWFVGKAVTYEVLETPFLVHLPADASKETISDLLHRKTVQLSEAHPSSSIVVYGIAAAGGSTGAATGPLKAVPLVSPEWKEQAFVIAEYNPLVDSAVRIRFVQPKAYEKQNAWSANLVRTALAAYIEEHGSAPDKLEQLLADYPHNYLSFLPSEAHTGSDQVRAFFDGTGGWVYRPAARSLADMFVPNVGDSDAPPASAPYEPMQLLVDTDEHRLLLVSGSRAIAQLAIGVGAAGHETPAGTYAVSERVLQPAGRSPGVYGEAALGLGAIAVHGTADASSIGAGKSLGCIRVANADMARLYPLVPRGTQVIVAGADAAPGPKLPPAAAQAGDTTSASVAIDEALADALLADWQRTSLARAAGERAPGKLFSWLG
ncbi:L,D-transpeptidase family protein [Paenibacillus sp. YYML68]|uniref:L,D-transpeptidase family protein n=1 Tax=Paenibacillus sp. YYML68 TaxID=2909250 RepID=UPI00249321ED|nr:L,D-transpeptidase family protein [Paenibacillus sp. YYML68]